MSVANLTVKIKKMTFVDKVQNAQNYFMLEDTRPAQRVAPNKLTFSITCGLNDSFAIANRYIAVDNIARQLYGNETQMRRTFEQQRGLTRATSVYYRLSECTAIARLSITVDPNNIRNVYTSYLSVYALPKGAPANGVLTCKQVAMNPNYATRITQFMLMSIWNRGILA